MKGRKPLPTQTKRLRGTARTDREPVAESVPDSARLPIDPPAELDGDAIGRGEWRRLVAILSAARLVTVADRQPLIAVCLEWSTYIRAVRLCRRGDFSVQRGSGGRGVAPAVVVRYRSLQALLRLWPELRMTPASRSRVVLDGPEPGGDSFSEFDTAPPTTTN